MCPVLPTFCAEKVGHALMWHSLMNLTVIHGKHILVSVRLWRDPVRVG